MTLLELPVESSVEPLLRRVLNDEWDAQSDCSAPLEPTAPVLAALDLVLAARPMGIFSAGHVVGATPDEIVAELHGELPTELSPWTRRSLERVAALRVPAPLRQPGRELAAPPPPDEPRAISPADVPQLPLPDSSPAPEPATEPVRQRLRAATARLVLLSAPLAAVAAALVLAIRGGVP